MNVELQASIADLEEVVVFASSDKTGSLNELATVSSRQFTVEEAGRYAGSRGEPARMAQKLHENIRYAKAELLKAQIPIMDSDTAILPIFCHQHCIYIQAIPYPVVPKGQARLRLSINTDHTKEQIDRLVEVLSVAINQNTIIE